MNCKSAEALFSDLFDGSLPPAQREQVDAHLAACGSCREGYAAFEGATVALQGSGDRAVGDDDLVARNHMLLNGGSFRALDENIQVPEPRVGLALIAGGLFLAALHAGRRRRSGASIGAEVG